VFTPIFLRLTAYEPYSNRIQVFKKILDKADKKLQFQEIYAEGMFDITKFMSLIFLGDMISFYLGILNNVDPTTIDNIKYLKNN
jgi:hypothetical protein